MKVASWNINSVRLREPLVLKFLAQEQPDILCLQETKAPVEKLPVNGFSELGYQIVGARGEPSYNGVMIISRLPARELAHHDFCQKNDTRHVAVELANGIRIHNLYVPAGGDVPDPAVNDKFAHKLNFVDEIGEWVKSWSQTERQQTIMVGDLNIAPFEHDVWSHKQLLSVVSHTPVEVEKLTRICKEGEWVDLARQFVPYEEKLYSWWSYRARDWSLSNRGRRLDHIWASASIAKTARSCRMLTEARGWDRPSDHVPVIAEFVL